MFGMVESFQDFADELLSPHRLSGVLLLALFFGLAAWLLARAVNASGVSTPAGKAEIHRGRIARPYAFLGNFRSCCIYLFAFVM